MSVTIRIPTTLRTLSGGASEVAVEGATVGEALDALESTHPGFSERLLDGEGGLRRFVNIFVADDDVRYLQGLDTPVPAGETVAIIPAVAGGMGEGGGFPRRRRPSAGTSTAALLVTGALVLGACGGGDDPALDQGDDGDTTTTTTAGGSTTTTSSTSSTPSSADTTTSSTGAPVELGQPVLWPAPGEGAAEPEAAAEGFVRILLDVPGGSFGEFAQGDSTSGEVPLFGANEGGGTGRLRSIILVRQLGDGWYVIGAVSDEVSIDSPSTLAEVPLGPLEVSGRGRGFEGNVVLTATVAGQDGAPLDQLPTIAGSAEPLEPYAVTLDIAGAADGDTIAIVATTGIGFEADAPGLAAIAITAIAL